MWRMSVLGVLIKERKLVLRSPYQWFGGKSKVTKLIWSRLGDVRNLVIPFFGSGAELLGRPQPFQGTETINDKDGFVCNFWRAIQSAPEEVAKWADWPVNECDLHARHLWLVNEGRRQGEGTNGRENAKRERIWFSPHCLPATNEPHLFTEADE